MNLLAGIILLLLADVSGGDDLCVVTPQTRPSSERHPVMASLIRPTRPYPLPVNPDIVTKDGKPHVRITTGGKAALYPLTRDGKKYLKRSAKWYGQYTDFAGVVRRKPLSPNKDAAKLMLAELVRRAEGEKAGVRDPFADHRKAPLATHLSAWEGVLTARGNSPDYVELKVSRVRKLLDACRLIFIGDLSASRVETALADMRDSLRCGIQTSNHYLAAIKQFSRWLVTDRRTVENPLAHLEGGNIRLDRRHDRRELTATELTRVLTAARGSNRLFKGLTGLDRYMLYATACGTGFRASELASLTPESFNLDGTSPVVALSAEDAKNRTSAAQPIPLDLAAELRPFLAGKPAGEPVWPGTWASSKKAAPMLRIDLEAAGIPYAVEGPDGPLYADFHALRHTYITLLDRGGVSLRTAQAMARHSTPVLTARYSHPRLNDLADAAEKLPRFLPTNPSPGSESAVLRATGTDGGCTTDALPDALTGGNERGQGRMIEESDGPGEESHPGPQPLKLKVIESNREQSERREWDSNPRTGQARLRFSRPAADLPKYLI
jgi:integrase